MEEIEASKTSTEIKILYREDLQSWIAVIWLRIRWEQQKYYLFHAMLEEKQEIIKRSTFYIERVLILTHLPIHHRKKNKRIWCLEPLSKKEQSIKKKAFLEEGTKNKGKAMSPELQDENSRIFHGK